MERFFADTNLFLRYLTNDVPDQASKIEELLKRAASGKVRLVTNSLVIAELVWTMDSYYGLSREEINRNILAILNTEGLDVEDAEIVLKSIFWFEEKNVDFIDAFNAAWLENEGLEGVYTFDRKHFSRLLSDDQVIDF